MPNQNLIAVILAAGKGTRMKSSTPKVLHKLFGKTILARIIDAVEKLHVEHCFVIVGHEHKQLEEEIRQLPYDNISTVLQKEQLGTGHALLQVYDRLYNFEGDVLVTYGDTPLLTFDTLDSVRSSHYESQASLTLLTANVTNPYGLGRIIRNNTGDFEQIVEEKDASETQKKIQEINVGVYYYKWQDILPGLTSMNTHNTQKEYYLTYLAPWALQNNLKVTAICTDNETEILGINSQKELAHAIHIMNQKHLDFLMASGVTIIAPNSTWISPETTIGNNTIIYPNTYIQGTNFIGHHCTIGPNTFIQGDVSLGDYTSVIMSNVYKATIGTQCTIGPFTNIPFNTQIQDNVRVGNYVEIKNSTINSNTNVAHLSYIGNANLGTDVNIGAGTITANYNALTQEKNTTIIENHCKIGSNTVLIAPVIVGSRAHIAAGSVITKDVPPGTLAIAREKQKIVDGWVDRQIEKVNT